MKRRWFEDPVNGGFFRNEALVIGEMQYALMRPWISRRRIRADLNQVIQVGTLHTDRLGRRDRVVRTEKELWS